MYKELFFDIRLNKSKLLILGAGISGFAAAELAARAGIPAELWDQAPRDKVLSQKQYSDKFNQLNSQGIVFSFEGESKQISPDFALVISSPGISPQSELFQACNGIRVISELELALGLIRECSDCKQIVVTGSNGKSTTVSLIQHILESCNKRSFLCGNIGASPLDLINADLELSQKLDFLVVEASSYQLELFDNYRPDVALMLNLSENHLERHKSMPAYLAAKARLVMNCLESDVLVLPSDASWLKEYRQESQASVRYFGTDASALVKPENASVVFDRGQQQFIYDAGNLLGVHNLKNIAAAILACESVGIDLSQAIEAARRFQSLEHRLERINLSNNQIAFNDSKATTAEASLAACQAVLSGNLNRKILLMLGGQEKKNSNWHLISSLILQNSERFQKVVFFGASAESIANHFAGVDKLISENLKSALEAVRPLLNEDNLLVFSPGCASFDEFRNFEERGQVFKELILRS